MPSVVSSRNPPRSRPSRDAWNPPPSGTFRWGWTSKNHGFQSQGVCGGVASLVVIEIKIDGFESCRPFFDLAGPNAQFFLAVAALIFARIRTVEPNVGEVCGDVERRVVSS